MADERSPGELGRNLEELRRDTEQIDRVVTINERKLDRHERDIQALQTRVAKAEADAAAARKALDERAAVEKAKADAQGIVVQWVRLAAGILILAFLGWTGQYRSVLEWIQSHLGAAK